MLGMVNRTQAEKDEIGRYVEMHSTRKAALKFNCDRDTASKYRRELKERREFLDEAAESVSIDVADETMHETLMNENHKLRHENEKLRNIIIDKMLED